MLDSPNAEQLPANFPEVMDHLQSSDPRQSRRRFVLSMWMGLLFLSLFGMSGRASEFLPLYTLDRADHLSAVFKGFDSASAKFQIKANEVRVPWSNLAFWGQLRQVHRAQQTTFCFEDGSMIVADLLGLDSSKWTLESNGWETKSVSRNRPVVIVFGNPPSVRNLNIEKMFSQPVSQDEVWMRSGDRLKCRVLRLEEEQLNVEITGAKSGLGIPLNRISLVRLTGNAPPSEKQRYELGLKDGSRLIATEMKLSKGELQFRLVCGLELTWQLIDTESLPLAFVRPVNPQVEYLSQRKPIDYRHVPFLSNRWPYHLDRTAADGRMRLSQGWVSKGIGMYSRSRLVFDLRDGDRWLDATLALDATARNGNVDFRVFLLRSDSERAGRWSEATKIRLDCTDQPRDLRVDLKGAESVALVIDFGERGDVGDLANWLNARVITERAGR